MAPYLKHLEEIARQVERLAGPEVRAQVMAGSEVLKGSSRPAEIAHWVQGAMDRLDALVDAETAGRIMLACGQNCARVNKTPLERAQARRRKSVTLDAFLEAEQRHPPAGTRLVREGDVLYHFYAPGDFARPMRCFCSLLRGLPAEENASLTYCQCSRGFVQAYWEGILGRPVEVDLVASCAGGAHECQFVVHLTPADAPQTAPTR
jgi:hypothetical protein